MTTIELEQLKFPIGVFVKPPMINKATIQHWIEAIETFPKQLETVTEGLSIEMLNWRYRPNGWTIKQVVHHCADSHMNSLIRFKLALTEEAPNIRPYWEDRWAELNDSLDDNVRPSLLLLKGLHQKWVSLLQSLTNEELEREFVHLEHGKRFSLKENIGIYAWHGKHHLAHIHQALVNKGKFNL